MINMKRLSILISALIFIIFLSSCQKNEGNEGKEECEHTYSYSLNDDYSKIICDCDNCDYSYEISPNFSFLYNYGYFDLEKYLIKNNAQKLYLDIYVDIYNFINDKKDLSSTIKNDKEYYIISTLNYSSYSLTKEQAMAIWHLVSLDNPEFYFLEKTVLTSNKELVILCNSLYAKHEQRVIVDNKINELKNTVNSYSDNHKLLIIYHYHYMNLRYFLIH